MSENTPSQSLVWTEFWNLLLRERAIILLLATTFALIAWQHWGMNRTIIFQPGSPKVGVYLFDDKGEGGNSVCSVERAADEWRFTYDVHAGISWAYCGIGFRFGKSDSARGIDLSRFETMVVNLSGLEGPHLALQTQLKSMDTNIYRRGETVSLKYMAMVLTPEGKGPSRSEMPLDYFVIPPWWVARNHVPIRYQYPDRTDVRELEFATAADVVEAGRGVVKIRSLEFHGKWIDKDLLLKILFATWVVVALIGLVWRLFSSLASIRRLQELADHDPLTRLHNRRGLESHLKALASRSIDPANPVMGVMMVDLDHFKTVNDTMGHDAGDEILRRLAGLIQEEMRPNNLAARWGGEEFILLLPGIPASRLVPAAEKVRIRVESELRYKEQGITASIGIAHGKVDEFEALAKRADEALYKAKEEGRNRVVDSAIWNDGNC